MPKDMIKQDEAVEVKKDPAVVIQDKDTKVLHKHYHSKADAEADRDSWTRAWPNAEAVEK